MSILKKIGRVAAFLAGAWTVSLINYIKVYTTAHGPVKHGKEL